MAEIRQIQVDGVNYDLVISEDEVSATAAAQSAAQALAYKNQAQSSAAQAGQQATNASNQADRAEDAALRAEAIVGGEFVSYGQAQGLDDAQKAQARSNIDAANDSDVVKITAQTLTSVEQAQARANIMAGGTNDNLLDNWYFVGGGSQLGDGVFPINQRGQTSYSGGGTQLDRWHGWAGTDTLVLTANGLQYTSPSSNGIFQYFPVFPTTETVTFSAKIGGTIYSVTLPEGQNQVRLDRPTFGLTVDRNDKAVGIFSYNSTLLLQAAKLEKGTYSTLANDAPPDFGEELRKCKRYLRYVPLTRTPAVISGNTAVVTLNGIEMASVPTPALISAGGARDAGGMQSITSATVTGFTYNTPTVQFALAGNLNYVIGYVYDTVLQLSCEL